MGSWLGKALATMPTGLSLISGNHMVAGEEPAPSSCLTSKGHHGTYTQSHTTTHPDTYRK